jgi:hypothetical protein
MLRHRRSTPSEEREAYREAVERATWVVFGSTEARDHSRPWQARENFAVNRMAVPRATPHARALAGHDRIRVAWIAHANAESDPLVFVQAFHHMKVHGWLDVSWLCWGEPADAMRTRRAEAFDRRLGRRDGRMLGSLASSHNILDALDEVDLFVSTGTGWDDPRPLLHAAARGATIVAPQICGLGERTSLGRNAWTYCERDGETLAERLESLAAAMMHQPEAWRQRSRHVFGCLWTFEQMCERWARLAWGAWHTGAQPSPGSR